LPRRRGGGGAGPAPARYHAGVRIRIPTCVPLLLAGACVAGPAASQGLATPVQGGAGGVAGYSGQRWSTDYGVRGGRCDPGALVLRTTDSRSTLVQRHEENLRNRSVGRIGAPEGSVLLLATGGARLGIRLDDRDRACLGGVLEFGAVGREVAWNNPATGLAYLATIKEDRPAAAGSGTRCRVLVVLSGPSAAGRPQPRGGLKPEPLIVCDSGSGAWKIP
jgi:hypothetical protein